MFASALPRRAPIAAALSAAALLAAGCGGGGGDGTGGIGGATATAGPATTPVHGVGPYRPGESFPVAFRVNTGTGYTWVLKRKSPFLTVTGPVTKATANRPGSPARQTFTVTVKRSAKPGTTGKVTFSYRPPGGGSASTFTKPVPIAG